MSMYSVVGLSASASQDNHEDGNTELPLDLLRMDPAVANSSLPNETLLRAAISLKEQVCSFILKKMCVVCRVVNFVSKIWVFVTNSTVTKCPFSCSARWLTFFFFLKKKLWRWWRRRGKGSEAVAVVVK